MSPSSRALLASIINTINPADMRVRDLISNLETSAIRTTSERALGNTTRSNIFAARFARSTPPRVVVYVLCPARPGATRLVINAVRYLAAHRNARGLWSIGHENAWAMMALNEAMVGLGRPERRFHLQRHAQRQIL
ncbi:MAG: hypothetical protein M0C28_44265 [Candidatus Moduliflexus flocculans]|nr:hypothetical protein [Candidatus Moduliflexus flocculans]